APARFLTLRFNLLSGGWLKWKERIQPRTGGQPQDGVGHLVHRVLAHLNSALQAVGAAHAREQQAQVVVDLRGSRHGRTRVTGSVLLPDGNGGRDPVNQVSIRLLDALQELPRVRRQRLDIPPLPLGVKGLEGERRRPRSRHSGDYRQRVMGYFEVDVLEVVDARAPNDDGFRGHQMSRKQPPAVLRPSRFWPWPPLPNAAQRCCRIL